MHTEYIHMCVILNIILYSRQCSFLNTILLKHININIPFHIIHLRCSRIISSSYNNTLNDVYYNFIIQFR